MEGRGHACTHPNVVVDLAGGGQALHLFTLTLEKIEPVSRNAVTVDGHEVWVISLKDLEGVCVCVGGGGGRSGERRQQKSVRLTEGGVALTSDDEHVVAQLGESLFLAILPHVFLCLSEPLSEFEQTVMVSRRAVEDDIRDGRILDGLDLEIAQGYAGTLSWSLEAGGPLAAVVVGRVGRSAFGSFAEGVDEFGGQNGGSEEGVLGLSDVGRWPTEVGHGGFVVGCVRKASASLRAGSPVGGSGGRREERVGGLVRRGDGGRNGGGRCRGSDGASRGRSSFRFVVFGTVVAARGKEGAGGGGSVGSCALPCVELRQGRGGGGGKGLSALAETVDVFVPGHVCSDDGETAVVWSGHAVPRSAEEECLFHIVAVYAVEVGKYDGMGHVECGVLCAQLGELGCGHGADVRRIDWVVVCSVMVEGGVDVDIGMVDAPAGRFVRLCVAVLLVLIAGLCDLPVISAHGGSVGCAIAGTTGIWIFESGVAVWDLWRALWV